jgi:hypothetical protein
MKYILNNIKMSLNKKKLTNAELEKFIKEEIARENKINLLKKRKKEIEKSLNIVLEYVGVEGDQMLPGTAPSMEKEEKKESLTNIKTGIVIVLEFQNVVIKIKRIHNFYFEVVDSGISTELKTGDILVAKDSTVLTKGKEYHFLVYRLINSEYISNPLASWEIIKN